MSSKINILYQSDNNYAPYLGVSLTSLLINNKTCEDIYIYILDTGISTDNLNKIKKTCEHYGRKCKLIDCRDVEAELQNRGIDQYRNSYTTFVKLFARNRLPQDVDRILYIDCDTLVVGNLAPLFAWDVDNKPIAMAEDALAYKYKKKLGFGKKEIYYNAGVILFNYAIWDSARWGEKLESFLKSKAAEKLQKHDQDILNIVFRNNVAKLPLRYNMQSVYYASTLEDYSRVYKRTTSASVEDLFIEKKEAVIMHFLVFNGESPWNAGNVHPHKAHYIKYLSESLWRRQEPAEIHLPLMNRIEKVLYRKLPPEIFLRIFKIVHDVFCLI